MHVRRHAAEDGDDGHDQEAQTGLGEAVPLQLPHGAPVVVRPEDLGVRSWRLTAAMATMAMKTPIFDSGRRL